jgi:hypothetical protein
MVTKIFPAAYVDGVRDVSHAGTLSSAGASPSWAWSEDGKPLSKLGRITRYQWFDLQRRVRCELVPAALPFHDSVNGSPSFSVSGFSRAKRSSRFHPVDMGVEIDQPGLDKRWRCPARPPEREGPSTVN